MVRAGNLTRSGGGGDYPVAALTFGAIERLIRPVQQLLGVVVATLGGGDADADGDVQLVWGPADGEWRGLHTAAQPFGNGSSELDVGVRHHHDKFLTAIAAGEIYAAHVRGNATRKLPQHFIAAVVTVIVVDRLEVVDIEDEKRDRPAGLLHV